MRGELEAARSQLAELDKTKTVLEEIHRHDEQRLAQFKEQIENHLKALAGETLKETRQEFLEQADQRLKPVREVLDRYNKSLQEIEAARSKAYGAMHKQMELMAQDQQRLRDETANLVTALRRPEVRGRWGEMQLRRVVELAGMTDRCDFNQQVSVRGTDGEALRPDMVVHLPSGRTIVIDAKTPLDAYIDSVEAAEPAERQAQLVRHADQVETQVRRLASKGYAQHFDRTPDFVILFLPGEAFLQAAAQQKPSLIEDAMAKGVVIATPSTLISLLHAVAMGWREQSLAENAREISEQGKEIHERLCVFASHLGNLRKAIAKAVEHHDKAIGSLDRTVMPAVRRLEELHAASARTWPDEDLNEINAVPRETKSLPSSDAIESHPEVTS